MKNLLSTIKAKWKVSGMKGLPLDVKQRIEPLLASPEMGCEAVKNSLGPWDPSNCYGTVAYVMGIRDPKRGDAQRPIYMGSQEFLDSLDLESNASGIGEQLKETPQPGDVMLVIGDDRKRNREGMCHAAVVVGQKGQGEYTVFEQGGWGGDFRTVTYNEARALEKFKASGGRVGFHEMK